MISVKPWERRLRDLAYILQACADSYFEPDRFRRNTNNFLQTARTVTFIIQKNKSEIPDFDEWYVNSVVEPWGSDPLMKWAKDARNKVEKQGDLELFSQLKATLVYSYLEEEDIELDCGVDELLNAGVKRLVRFARKNFPSGIINATSVKIERKWISEKIEDYELLSALGYVYSRLYAVCKGLATHLDRDIPENILKPGFLTELSEGARKVAMIKLSDMKRYSMSEQANGIEDKDIPKNIRLFWDSLSVTLPHDFNSLVEFFSKLAPSAFDKYGFHQTMIFLYDDLWQMQTFITPNLSDQNEKYFFWRLVGEKIKYLKSACVVSISEVWHREVKGGTSKPIKDMPIMGESLQLLIYSKDHGGKSISWPIRRGVLDDKVRLGNQESDDMDLSPPYLLIPAIRAMGVEPSFVPPSRVKEVL